MFKLLFSFICIFPPFYLLFCCCSLILNTKLQNCSPPLLPLEVPVIKRECFSVFMDSCHPWTLADEHCSLIIFLLTWSLLNAACFSWYVPIPGCYSAYMSHWCPGGFLRLWLILRKPVHRSANIQSAVDGRADLRRSCILQWAPPLIRMHLMVLPFCSSSSCDTTIYPSYLYAFHVLIFLSVAFSLLACLPLYFAFKFHPCLKADA